MKKKVFDECQQPEDRFVDTNEGGPMVGIAPYTLRKWGWQGRVVSYKIGRRRLFRVSDLKALLERCRSEADSEMAIGKK